MDSERLSTSKLIFRRAPATLLGVLILGLVCTMLYDLAVKPGLSLAGRIFLDILTLGSQRLRDASYASAAIDPAPVTSLILLTALLSAAFFPAITLFYKFLPRSTNSQKVKELLRKLRAAPNEKKQEISAQIEGLRKKRKRRVVFLIIPVMLIYFYVFLSFAVHNQSVLIWRTFHANLAILRPHISELEEHQFLSEFSSMKRKSDYLKIKKTIDSVATRTGVKLHDFELW